MAGSILVKDVLYRVSKDLGDIAPQFNRWTQRELVNALNDGQRAIAKYLPSACARVDSIKLSAGTKQSIALILAANIKPGDGSTAVDVRGNMLQYVTRLMGADGLVAGRALRIVDRDVLDAVNPDWNLATSTGKRPTQYTFDPRTPQIFYVAPGIPAADTVWVEVAMLADPAALPNIGSEDYGQASADTHVLSIDDKYLDDLMHYMMARSNMKDTESQASMQKVSAYTSLFVNSINAQAMAMTGVNPNLQSLPFSGQVPATAR